MKDDVDVTRTAAPRRAFGGQRPFRSGDLVAGRFRVVREIAEGGMGIVYEAIDEKLVARRALKCAKAGYASRLSPEARTSLRVTHANVCRVFEIHSTDTALGPVDFLTMEYVDGGTLSKELRERGGLPEPEARAIALQICAGVAAAHAQNLLHRDLKSSNVLMTRDAQGNRRAVVTDFGLAQEPAPIEQVPAFGDVAGTPAYLAPERWAGAPATIASDVFALGVVLHELVTGTRPAVGEAGAGRLAPEVPTRWRPIVGRCLDPDPARRFASVAEIGDTLSGKGRWTRFAAWTTAALVPLALIAWPLLFPAPLAARLAILPIESGTTDPQMTALARGSSSELSSRLSRLHPRSPQLVIIPVEETRGVSRDDVGEAKDRLGASHVLKATVTRQGDQLLLQGSIVDTSTKLTFGERTGRYPPNDPGAVASALSAMVASTFHLPRQTPPETISPQAYAIYAEGVEALQTGAASFSRAVSAFERAAELDPGSALPPARLAEACYNAWLTTADPQWLTRGRDAISRAERLNADSISVRLAAGRLSLVPGGYERAMREYRRATELDPVNPDGWSGLARAFVEMHDHDDDAIAAFTRAIELQPGYFRPFIDLGDFYRRLGNHEEAEKQWLRVVTLAPQSLAGHSNLGGLYSDMGRYEDAGRELTHALEIAPASRQVLNNLGALSQYVGRDGEAVAYFERARALGPETHILLLNVGDSYRRLGRMDEAAMAYRKGRDLADAILIKDPKDAAVRAFVGYFALRLGDAAGARRELEQALSSGSENRTVIRRAAISYEALGDRARVLELLQLAPSDVIRELGRQPDLEALRADPRFLQFIRKD